MSANNQANVFFKIIRFVGNDSKKNYKLPYYKDGYYLKYITRDDACCKHNLTNEQLKDLKNKYQNPKYYHKELKKLLKEKDSTGIWNQNGQLAIAHKIELENKIKNLDPKQLFWDTVISFKQEFANKYELFTPIKMQEIAKANLNKFFLDNNMNPRNMEWFFTFHTNTDNPHIHLAFFEKTPIMYNKKTKSYEYRRKGAIPISNCKTTAFKIENYLDKTIDYQELQHQRNKVTKEFKVAWTDAKQIYTDLKNINSPIQVKLQELVQLLNYKKGKVNYQKPYYYQQSELMKTKLNEFSSLLINEIPALKEKYLSFNETINKYQNLLNDKGQTYKTEIKDKLSEKTKIIMPWEHFYQEQLYGQDGFYSRLGNEILKTINQLPKYKKIKQTIPYFSQNRLQKTYFKPNLINKLIKQIDDHFYYAQQKANYQFKQLQAIKIHELNKLS